MAPRAGVEIHRKYVMQEAVDSRKHADTPSNTPIPSATNCEGEMGEGIAALVPSLDHVFAGESEVTFV